MIEALIKRGFGGKERVVTKIVGTVEYGELNFFYIDTNYNVVKPYHIFNNIIKKNNFTVDNFSQQFLFDFLRELDELSYQKDIICRCIFIVWRSPLGEKIIAKAGDSIWVKVVYEDWCGTYLSESLCLFGNTESDKALYMGSGACLPLVESLSSDEYLFAYSLDSMSYLKSKDASFVFEKKYRLYLDSGRTDLILDEINYDFFCGKQKCSQDLFFLLSR